MSTFNIDFYELAFLAEACIPPRPIARSMFWNNLTSVYWHKMSDAERAHLFDWMNKNDCYKESLLKQSDTQVFHARFDPDNQYIVTTNWNGRLEEHRVFKQTVRESDGESTERYYTGINSHIVSEYITSVNKFTPKREY
jgi:hypothetical protein